MNVDFTAAELERLIKLTKEEKRIFEMMGKTDATLNSLDVKVGKALLESKQYVPDFVDMKYVKPFDHIETLK